MWSVRLFEDPATLPAGTRSKVVLAERSVASFPALSELWKLSWVEGKKDEAKTVGVALADFLARHIFRRGHVVEEYQFSLEPLTLRRKYASGGTLLTPYVLERTDVFVVNATLYVYLRMISTGKEMSGEKHVAEALETLVQQNKEDFGGPLCLKHIATAVFQDHLRDIIGDTAVAFVADGSILPRRSGSCAAPMASPPAIPFSAPGEGSSLRQTLKVEMGRLSRYLTLPGCATIDERQPTIVILEGLLIPRGVSLIVGGGYHGKSTLLRCIAAGVYNKIPGDGREFCVTVADALTIRAEDGRYVSSCNVSAFISNLPTPSVDTTKFSSREASGSTSQAANVVEAIELGASAFLVDEDVSAANFMARDGRMRALVMDESITPFLYRVNGIFGSLGISSIVVVGGVGDWLDVPHSVVLMDKYICRDATAKARSISRQFSHGHVQYAGRGVVHRLQWDKSGTPSPRRPVAVVNNEPLQCYTTQISILDGHQTISLESTRVSGRARTNVDAMLDDDDENETNSMIDLSRIEQLLGRKSQVYGCGACVAYILDLASKQQGLSLRRLLDQLEKVVHEKGLGAVLQDPMDPSGMSPSFRALIRLNGFAYRPRSLEVGQAVARLQCLRFEDLSMDDSADDESAKAEEERKKQSLMELWNSRRTKKVYTTEDQ